MLSSRVMAETMRAMAALGDGVEITEIPKPMPGQGEVRVRVIASAVNAGEEKVISGDFVGRFLHAKTSPLVLGWDFAERSHRSHRSFAREPERCQPA